MSIANGFTYFLQDFKLQGGKVLSLIHISWRNRARTGSECTSHYIRKNVLLDLVLEDMRRVLRYVKEHEQDFICKATEYGDMEARKALEMCIRDSMKSVDPKTVDRSTLVQRSSVRLDPTAPREDRLRDFIQQIKNPYCYLDGKTVVKISFANTDTTMEDCLEHYLRGL